MSIDVRKKTEEEVRISTMSSAPSVENETQAAPVAPVEEDSSGSSSGGAFSQQKGGSAALALSAMIDAMNTQLEAVKLKRHRAEISIDNQSKATTLQADNLTKIGNIEMWGGILMGALGIVGGAASLRGAYNLSTKSIDIEKAISPLQMQSKQLTNHSVALEKLAAAQNGGPADVLIASHPLANPDPAKLAGLKLGDIGTVGKTGRMVDVAPDGTETERVLFTHAGDPLDADLNAALAKLPQDNADALIVGARNTADVTKIRDELSKKMAIVEKGIREETDKLNTLNMHTAHRVTGMNALFSTAGVQLVKGLIVDPLVKEEEAKQLFNKYSADAASESRQAEVGAAQAREDDFNKTLALLSQMTSADLRA